MCAGAPGWLQDLKTALSEKKSLTGASGFCCCSVLPFINLILTVCTESTRASVFSISVKSAFYLVRSEGDAVHTQMANEQTRSPV